MSKPKQNKNIIETKMKKDLLRKRIIYEQIYQAQKEKLYILTTNMPVNK